MTEHDVQCAICDYLDIRRICYWAVPNGGKRSRSESARFKKEGVRSGVPDLSIVHDGMYYGLEVKKPATRTPKGYLSKNQKSMIKQIEDVGKGEVKVVYSVADVIEALIDWGISV